LIDGVLISVLRIAVISPCARNGFDRVSNLFREFLGKQTNSLRRDIPCF
jgi:hypothetical protein